MTMLRQVAADRPRAARPARRRVAPPVPRGAGGRALRPTRSGARRAGAPCLDGRDRRRADARQAAPARRRVADGAAAQRARPSARRRRARHRRRGAVSTVTAARRRRRQRGAGCSAAAAPAPASRPTLRPPARAPAPRCRRGEFHASSASNGDRRGATTAHTSERGRARRGVVLDDRVLLRLQARHRAALALGVGAAQGIEDVRHGEPARRSVRRVDGEPGLVDAGDAVELHEGRRSGLADRGAGRAPPGSARPWRAARRPSSAPGAGAGSPARLAIWAARRSTSGPDAPSSTAVT